jgi:hypothetical protein
MISALNRIFCALIVDFIDKILTLLLPDALRRVVCFRKDYPHLCPIC